MALYDAAHAQAPRIDRIDIFEKGVFQNERTQSRPDPKSPTGTHDTVTNIRLVENTTTVRARHGVDVGIRFTVVGAPQGAVVPLKVIQRYPKAGIRNPQTGQTTYIYEHSFTEKIGGSHYDGYGFDNPWEEVPGVWTFEVWYQGRKLATQSVTVTK